MRISDWSSDVCSSDLLGELLRSLVAVLVDDIERRAFEVAAIGNPKFLQRGDRGDRCKIGLILDPPDIGFGLSVQKGVQRQIGRASCRERVLSVRVDLGGRRIIKKKKKNTHIISNIIRNL